MHSIHDEGNAVAKRRAFQITMIKMAGKRPATTLEEIAGAFKSITTHAYNHGVRIKDWNTFDTRLWQ
jgi:hypothetical protein